RTRDHRGLDQALAVLVGKRRQQRQARASEGDRIEIAGLARLHHLQVLELLQPLVDQLVGEAAQPTAEHLDVAADLDHGEQPPIVGWEIDLEGKVAVAELRRGQGFVPCGGERVDEGCGHGRRLSTIPSIAPIKTIDWTEGVEPLSLTFLHKELSWTSAYPPS